MLTAIKQYIKHLYFNDKDNTIFEVYNDWYGGATCDNIDEVLDDEYFLEHLIEDIGIENIEESLRDWGYEKVVTIYKTYSYWGTYIAQGETLKDACEKWNNQRSNCDDLYEAFKKSSFYIKTDNWEEENEAYDKWLNSITGEEMFEIMRDRDYNYYLEKWEIC